MKLKALAQAATVILALTNVYWVLDTMREHRAFKAKLKEAQAGFAGQATAGPKKAANS
jgi:hypothetical protein